MERLVDAAAAEMGIDRVALRRRNQIRPQELPLQTASSSNYDSGDFIVLTKRALELADSKGFARRKRESRKRGKLRGLGVTNYLEVTAGQVKELAEITFNGDGTVTLATGTLDFGMGHATPFAQVLSERLGVPFEKINMIQGDSDRINPVGGGSGGSKSLMHSGTAIIEGAAKVIDNGKQLAAYVLEAAPADITFENGRFVIVGTDRAISIMELAQKLHTGLKPPADVPQSLDVMHVSDGPGPSTYPNLCPAPEVDTAPPTRLFA